MKRIAYTFAALAIAQTAFSQDVTGTQQLEEVVVTANKTEQKQATTGKVITVINKEQLNKSAGRTVAQVLNEQAGITINGALNNAGSVQTVYMRGSSSGRTLILIDGIPVSDASMINNEYDLNLFSINDVERIEICKGAQSTLYGSDAIGGVINIITLKKDINKPFNIKATAAGGNRGTFKGNAAVYGKSGNLTYTARYAKLRTDGFSAAYDSTGNKGFDNDGYNGNASNAMVQYQANKQLLFKAFTMYNQYKTDLDGGAFSDSKTKTSDNNSLNTGGGFQFKNEVVNLAGNYQYTQTHRYTEDASSSNDFRSIAQFVELYASVKLGGGFSLLQGADYRYGSMNSENKFVQFPQYNSTFKDTAISQGSMYSSLNYNSDHFNVELGGRLNVHSSYGSNYTYTFNPSYTINTHYRVFGSIARGFKAPSLYQVYGPYGDRKLKPEESTNYEIGIQQQYNVISHRAVFFHRNITNGIDFNNLNSVYFNFLEQKVSGLEYEVSVKPVQALTLTANYTLLTGKERTQSRITSKDSTYKFLLRRPKHSINMTAGYQFSQALYASVSGKYVSSRYDVGGYQVADTPLNSYFIMNAYAEYKAGNYLKFFADAQNLTGKKFFDVRGYNSIPFLINAGVTFNL
jgi:vitamin B12 transporter